ncbi:MAG: hypothetical protein ACREP6_02755 [Candidatus Binataceae bacterium]
MSDESSKGVPTRTLMAMQGAMIVLATIACILLVLFCAQTVPVTWGHSWGRNSMTLVHEVNRMNEANHQ